MKAFLAALTCLLLAACVGPVGFQDAGQRAAALSAFRSGNAQLGCAPGQNCLLQWLHTRPAAARLAQAQRWDDLADVVLAANYDEDLAWTYLGVAAAGLGYAQPARLYLDRAVQRSIIGGLQSCQPNCDGVDVATTVRNTLARLAPEPQVASRAVRRRPVVRHVALPAGQATAAPPSGAPAAGDGWVPPVPSAE